ncbi:MAG: methylenetetrahydrofolate reductase C-terminal domain-containing protein [Eubacteriaceae bacterium]|nr:methylenetetrahydrofolate reductase C-terminal domain-containing protein [Eubacteriaceae bacterium]
MIISQKKPREELLAMLSGVKKAVLVGCGECATVCMTGGDEQLEEMKAFLEENGISVLASLVSGTSCNKLLVKKELKEYKDAIAEADCIISMSCGDGVQTVASNVSIAVYPANNTMFLGEVERVGLFTEACRFCGDCVLANTGAICPITKCAKSLTSGPCGGAKGGHCEVNPDNRCAWIMIYEKLQSLGTLEKLDIMTEPKGFSDSAYPRTISLRGSKE